MPDLEKKKWLSRFFGQLRKKNRAQGINWETAQHASQKKKNSTNPIYPHLPPTQPTTHSKTSFLKKIQTYPETSQIISLSLLVSFKRDKNIGNFLVGSALLKSRQPTPGTFKCTCSRCKTCPFIHNATKISEPKQSSIKDRFTCRSTNYVYCIIFTLCRKPA